MSLTRYHQKRSFKATPEPKGRVNRQETGLRFVIQQHAASHLHYDFRLEMEGVLKSWAVPKGPSTDPDVKRLAMMVEDHPYDYRDFEGVIPEGNYGAGTVIVWDEGTYEPTPDKKTGTKKAQEKLLLQELNAGRLKFVLHGHKLKGSFALVKSGGRGENAWLLMKLQDKYATTDDITLKDKSVLSGKNLAGVAKSPQHLWTSNRKKAASPKQVANTVMKAATQPAVTALKKKAPHNTAAAITALLKKGTRTAFPEQIKPMLATRVDQPFDHADWLYEIKWDGYRAVAYVRKGKVQLLSRNNLSFTEKFAPVTASLKSFPGDVVLDGEIVAVNNTGNPDFQALQGYLKHGAKAHLLYQVFDVLWYNGRDYTQLPLLERKEILRSLLPEEDAVIRFSDHITGEGKAFFKAALEKGLEGVMAKDGNSTYDIGARSSSWLKVKNEQFTEAIICGFTKPRNSRKHFGAVVLGKYAGNKLVYIGHSGSGINDKDLAYLYQLFQPLITNKPPLAKVPKTNMPVTWLKPKLVCEVKYTEWTADKSLRHPIFMGLREDKTARTEKNEKLLHVKTKKTTNAAAPTAAAKKSASVKSSSTKAAPVTRTASRKAAAMPQMIAASNKETVLKVNKHELAVKHLDKLYWPKDGITKRDMLNYYGAVMPYMLPYMKNRPQSLNRTPDGIEGPSFYQKDVTGKVPDWITTFPYVSESDGLEKQFLVCTDEASLLYIATLGCIEMNPWHSRVQKPDNPDWCVIDLDPDDNNTYDQVVAAALAVKAVLDDFNITAYPKTSGASGMHIYIPLGARYSYDQSRMLAQLIVTLTHDRIPDFTSLERSPAKRKGKLYLDYLQNRTIQTIAAPYSLRPKPGATVSTPLDWLEVKKGLLPSKFTIRNTLARINSVGDLFKPVLGKGIQLAKLLQQMKAAS
ncbi:DNA ligase D [Deminuibacter soli]|uniref:DNA ligase (ATP) n=2 Tax=Deminuibacter soli TaxID=2291815 RepID=A0A3E1NEI8_9BACT|nr:DNA ligase D [Deminuibacter soli]